MSAARTPSLRRTSRPVAVLVAGLLVIVLGIALLIRSGGTARVVDQSRSVAPFRAIELAGSNVVSITVGAPRFVVVRARSDMLALVRTRVRGDALVIADSPGRHNTKGPMSVTVGVPSLESVTIGPRGSGIVDLSGVAAKRFTATLAGSGVMRASGTVARLVVRLTGSGDVEFDQLSAPDVRAVVRGSGRVSVTATRSLRALVLGSGVIQYRGDPPHRTTRVEGSGAIIAG